MWGFGREEREVRVNVVVPALVKNITVSQINAGLGGD